ncbi:hypothetical protein ACO2Q2_09680 [Dyella sp. KRB-257]|uniref:hypothetical protein n=1 Tax=Dyella sp. KRB-257 TaxID=3400915 RepID=UPI003BFA8BA9
MTSRSKTTTDHEEIRRWVEQHDGVPAKVKDTGSNEDPGILRIDFPGGASEEALEHVDWDVWFEKFDKSNVAFLYQQEKASGEDSTFFKLVRADE